MMPQYEGSVRAARLAALEPLLVGQPERWWSTRELAEIFGVTEDTMAKDLRDASRIGHPPLRDNGKATAGFRWQVAAEAQHRPQVVDMRIVRRVCQPD